MPRSLGSLVSTRREYDHVASIYLPIAIGVFALVLVLTVAAVLRYRHRTDRDSGPADLIRTESAYAVLLALVAAMLIYLTLGAEHRVDTVANQERPALVVDVTGARWEWQFRYPGHGIVRRSGTSGDQPLVVPADRAIRFNLVSQDVIHSFWIPELRFKRDLFRGTVEHVTLTFTRTGSFRGQCAEFCGLRHAEMVFRVVVLTPERFSTWLTAHGRGRRG
jgi:cytochrome c oxidase subunit II